MLTQLQVDDAVNKILVFTGKHIAMPNNLYYGECTAPIAWYLYYLGLPIPPMFNNRADGWGVVPPTELTPHFSFESFSIGRAYPRGSILMWDSPHIAVVLADAGGDNGVICFEQNADPDGAPCGTHTRILNNAFHHATYAMVPLIEPPKPVGPPYWVEQITPKQVKVHPGMHKWGMNYDNLEAMQANPIDTAGDNTIITVSELVHHNIGYNYYRGAGETDGWNVLDCDDYIPPTPPPYTPPAAPLPVKLAPKMNLVTNVPYFATANNAKNGYKAAGVLPTGVYYQISTDNGMWNLSSDNMKDLQHWVNPVDNVEPPTPEPPIGFETWKSTYVSFNPNRKPVKYVMMQTYTAEDIGGTAPPRTIKQYTEVPIYGTFKGEDGRLYGRLKLAADTEWKYWYGVPMIPEVVELEQEIYNPEIDVTTRQATKQLTFRDYEILALDKVERVAKTVEHLGGKFIDGITRRKK